MIHTNEKARLLSLMALAVAVSLAVPTIARAQGECVAAVNKAGGKLAAAQGKNNAACVKDAGKGKLPQGIDADECPQFDGKGKVAKALGKVDKAAEDRCVDSPPAFGFTSADAVKLVGRDLEMQLLDQVFGLPRVDTIIDGSVDKDGARCQSSVAKAYEKLAATFVKDFNGCKKTGFATGSIVDVTGIEACVGQDSKGKVGKAADKVAGTATKRCAGIDLVAAFPGDCGAAAALGAPDLASCVVALTRCSMCTMLNGMDAAAADCDVADNGISDASCSSVCGDGILTSPEECDDAGESITCDVDCTLASCGDGTTNQSAGEQCDDAGESATCNTDCTFHQCGDGVVNAAAGEACDDGNVIEGDGCDTNCTVTACGNGVVTAGEDCDDGNTTGGDGCDAACVCEPGSLALGCTDPQCPGRVDLTLLSGTGETCATNGDCLAGVCDAGLGRCATATARDRGWSGINHDEDSNDGVVTSLSVACTGSPTCGECLVTGIDPSAGNCRCNTDSQVACNDPFSVSTGDCSVGASCTVDADCRVCSQTPTTSCLVDSDCPSGEQCLNGLSGATCIAGQCAGTCNCYDGPPLATSSGNTPTCALRIFQSDVTGTLNVDTGARKITKSVRSVIYLGERISIPCPACGGTCAAPVSALGNPCLFDADCDDSPGDGVCANFDAVAGDGSRDGTCVLGQDEGRACDVMATDHTFPAPGGGGASLDCLPSLGKNISGFGLLSAEQFSTGPSSLSADVPCGFTFLPELCPCGLCDGGVGDIPCSSDAECVGNGVCDRASQGNPRPNNCSDQTCVDVGGGEGECVNGPTDSFCDGALRANGEPFVNCLSNADCDQSDCGVGVGTGACGDCTITRNRECFLDPIITTGAADPDAPLSAALYCAARTSGNGVNTVIGLPGPVRAVTQEVATYACEGDPGSSYTPGVGGCP